MSKKHLSDIHLQKLFFETLFHKLILKDIGHLDLSTSTFRAYHYHLGRVVERRLKGRAATTDSNFGRLLDYLRPHPITGIIEPLERALFEHFLYAHRGHHLLLSVENVEGVYAPDSIFSLAEETAREFLAHHS